MQFNSLIAATLVDEFHGTLSARWAALAAATPRCLHVHHQYCHESSRHRLRGRRLPVSALQLLCNRYEEGMDAYASRSPHSFPWGSFGYQRHPLHYDIVYRSVIFRIMLPMHVLCVYVYCHHDGHSKELGGWQSLALVCQSFWLNMHKYISINVCMLASNLHGLTRNY